MAQTDPLNTNRPWDIVARQRHNSVAPVSKLPAELLTSTMSFLQQDQFSSATNQLATTHSFLHVCAGWRRLAIGFPRLWTSITDTLPKWIPKYLEWSGAMPLYVRLRRDLPQPERDILLKHVERFRVLDINAFGCSPGPVDRPYDLLLSLTLLQPLPRLVQLETFKFVGSSGFPVVPDCLFSHGELPALQNLTLHVCGVSWIGNLPLHCPTLTHLEVVVCRNPGAQLPSTVEIDLSHVLEHLHFLSFLRIDRGLRLPEILSIVPSLEHVSLPHLTILDLEAGICDCIDFMTKLRSPQLATLVVAIHGDAESLSEERFDPFVHSLIQRMDAHTSFHDMYIIEVESPHPSVNMQFNAAPPDDSDLRRTKDGPVRSGVSELSISTHCRIDRPVAATMEPLARLLAFPRTTFRSILDVAISGPTALSLALHAMLPPNPQYAVEDTIDGVNVLEKVRSGGYTCDAAGVRAFPGLACLLIKGVPDLRKPLAEWLDPHTTSTWSPAGVDLERCTLLSWLRHALESRYRCAKPVTLVGFDLHSIDEEYMSSIRKEVAPYTTLPIRFQLHGTTLKDEH